MATHRRLLLAVIALATFALSIALPRRAGAQDHRFWAEDLVANVPVDSNGYASPSEVLWAGFGGAQFYSSQATCSGFLTRTLQRAYEWDDATILAWMGAWVPSAAGYHDAIVAGNGFERVLHVDEIEAGDIIAIRYPEDGNVTGHVAIVQSAPTARAATSPKVAGAFQFAVTVIDSSSTGHGTTDTRRKSNGTYRDGAGIGVMRLYADADLSVVGHTWSTTSGSTYRDMSTHSLVVGRLL